MAKKIPERQCIGCQEKKQKNEFIRIVRSAEGQYSLDEGGRKPGRGAYLCKSSQCLELVCKKHGLDRAFKETVPGEVYDQLREEMNSLG